MADKTIRVATDVGGTFTDLVCCEVDNNTGQLTVRTEKSDTTPPNFEQGVLNVIKKGEIDPASIDFMVHGTTVVINSLTERKGVKVGLITTEGFRDTLEIARGNRPDFFNLHYKKPAPFVERYLRRELPGRMSYLGEELEPLDLKNLSNILSDFKADGVEAVAISFLHSYADPTHERNTMAKVQKLWPEVSVVSSHQITREWREYERSNTAVLSAYVQPIAQKYLSRLDEGLSSQGFSGKRYIMQSNCGVDSLEAVGRIPITMVESGPASGFWGAAELGRLIGEENVLALDIGGTTAKCSLIENGHVKIMTDYWIELDLVEIGNGGGSIAWVDQIDKLHVGPQSAGALPGPAAYGKGGTSATTTDANLWLGRISKDYFCGGSIDADMQAVETALTSIGKQLGVSTTDAARGIVRIANNNMVNALKLVSLNRGHDPRDFTLVAFGGGGAMHAVALAKDLGVSKVVVPAEAAVFSAWGMMMSDLRRDYFVTHLVSLADGAEAAIEAVFARVEKEALEQFSDEGIDKNKISFARYGKFRYQNQEHTTEVQLSGKVSAANLEEIAENFRIAYEKEYTYRLNAPVEMMGVHVIVQAEVGKLRMKKQANTDTPASVAKKSEREVDYATEGTHVAQIYNGEKLEPGMTLDGPAIIEDSGTTIVIHPGDHVSVDGYRNIIINLSMENLS